MSIRPDHIVIVVEENQHYSSIIGSPDAPFINFLADGGALFTNYQGITNPSQPNYLALFSGSTHGVVDNGTYLIDAPTLAGQLAAAGLSFAGYKEAGSPRRHNPWESFVESQGLGKDFRLFPADFNDLPTVSFVSPNLINDMHDGTIQQGDAWLEANLGDYAAWAKENNSLLIVTFDEGSEVGENHIPTIVYGAGVLTGDIGLPSDHYDLLRTIQSLYGLSPLGLSAQADVLRFWSAGSDPANPAPTDIAVEGGLVLENAAVGTVVATLSASDATPGEALTYGLTGAEGVLRVVGNQIQVAEGARIDYEATLSFRVTVTVTDSAGGRHSERLTIGVQDVEEGQSFVVYGTKVAETMVGTTRDDEIWGRAGSDTLWGLEGRDRLFGEGGKDNLDGGRGADAMAGGLGPDRYWVDDAGDAITELAGQGLDTVETTLNFYSLDTAANANLETVIYDGGGSFHGIGNALTNTLVGRAGHDTLSGGAGNDILRGGNGADTMTGGAGADDFDYLATGASREGTGIDRILDFAPGVDDILLTAVDADTGSIGNQAFVLDANGSFSVGEIRQRTDGGDLILDLNVDADAAVEMTIRLVGLTAPLAATDFAL